MKDNYGRFDDGSALWRVVFSEDQLEKRFDTYVDFDDNGIKIREVTEWREIPKYPWIKGKHLLEHYTIVPFQNKHELTTQVSYEPVWVFEDKHGNALPAKWEVIEIVIDTIHKKALEAVGYAKYKLPEDVKNPEAKKLKIDKMVEELFGNETDTGDALAHKQAIIVPRNYRSEK